MELTINGKVYKFKASIAFMRAANKLKKDKEGVEYGLRYLIAGLIDGDIESLINAIDLMNLNMDERITKKEIEDFIEDEATDIDKVFEDVIDFLSKANVSKKTYSLLMKEIEALKKKKDQN